MENRELTKRKSKPARGKEDGVYKIILVQFLACAFMALLLAIVCRLDAGAVKTQYDRLMRSDLQWHEVWNAVKEVASFVTKPVDVSAVPDAVTEPQPQTGEAEQAAAEQPAADAPSAQTEDTASDSQPRSAAAVMSLFADAAEITPPLHGRLTSRFGSRVDPISGEGAVHRAVDIAAPEGTRVGAAWDGIVTEAGTDAKKGNYVWMVHKNGCETLYCHCASLLVKAGDVIRAGETIALSGTTGYSTGPHLHFGIRRNGEMVDPLQYLTEQDRRI